MIKFRNFDQIEHKYAFEDAVASADTFNEHTIHTNAIKILSNLIIKIFLLVNH